MEWISVKDRLPEEGQEVLLFALDQIWLCKIKGFEAHGKYFSFFGKVRQLVMYVTHWMPLPEGPNGE